MKLALVYSPKSLIGTFSASCAFLCSYFLGLTLDNAEQFLSVGFIILLDGLFGICAGVSREGFKTYKALKILKTLIVWWVILAAVLSIEKGFSGTDWVSETIMVPFLLFQVISVLKNASLCGYIKVDVLNNILSKIDQHKGEGK